MSGTRRKPGRMGPFVAGFRTSLSEQGYSDLTVRKMLKDVGAVGRWMQGHDLQVSQLTPAVIAEFCSDCLAAGTSGRDLLHGALLREPVRIGDSPAAVRSS